MQSAIDFGKNFLTQYFTKKDADATSAFLSDDIIWITPNEIRHLKNVRSIREFLRESLQEDPKAYTVDIAALHSAPGLEPITVTVFDVNLIPKHEESSVNMRVTLALRQQGTGYVIAYVGMSRKFLRTDVEQIRGFSDALPAGIMTLSVLGSDIRVMYASGWFYEHLGLDEAICYERMDQNPFFMLAEEDQKRMVTLVSEMGTLKRPKPLGMEVTLQHDDRKTKYPCHMSIGAAYKDGSRTILYLLFDEIGDLVHERERDKRKAEKARKDLEKQIETLREENGLQKAEEIRKKAEEEVAETKRIAEEESSAAMKLIQTKLEQAAKDQKKAVEEARQKVTKQFTDSWKQEKKKHAEERSTLQAERDTAREEAGKYKSDLEKLQKEFEELQAQKEKAEKDYQDRILKLQWELSGTQKKADADREELEKTLTKDKEDALLTAQQKAQEEKTQLEKEKDQLLQTERDRKAELEGMVLRQQKELSRQETALQQRETEQQILAKEKDKSILRMQSLLQGQMGSIQSAARAAKEEKRPEQLHRQVDKIAAAAASMPEYVRDLAAISGLNPNERSPLAESSFSVRSCLDLVRLVIWPQCRQKGIVFSVEMTEGMPDQVTGGKAGLELAFLCILENAIENTASGGKITLAASADQPVRGSAYYHFCITDNGQGISEDKLPILFDQPESELAIARKVMSTMGGSIQVRSKAGEGASFEIHVSLAVKS